jgi:hypothetical protein
LSRADYLYGNLGKVNRKMTDKTWIQIQTEPVKELKKKDLKLAASRRIRDDNGLTLFSITGKQQSGKSSYALLILNEIYDGDVDQVMNHICFSMEDLTEKISAAIHGGYRDKCILWDDASLTGSAARWTTDPKMVMYLAGLGDTLGIAVKSLILTSPSGNMIKAFRDYAKYKVLISNGKHKYDRVARGYWIGKSPMDQRWCSIEFSDEYDTRIPFYERYAQKRKELSLSAVNSLETFLKTGHDADPQNKIDKPVTIKERAKELYRDWQAGVFGDMTLSDLAKSHKINYGYMRTAVL